MGSILKEIGHLIAEVIVGRRLEPNDWIRRRADKARAAREARERAEARDNTERKTSSE
jgi:hypothetical protein